ncbi:hypothetical protein PV327_009711, partial [Microctonus hyperodae]
MKANKKFYSSSLRLIESPMFRYGTLAARLYQDPLARALPPPPPPPHYYQHHHGVNNLLRIADD